MTRARDLFPLFLISLVAGCDDTSGAPADLGADLSKPYADLAGVDLSPLLDFTVTNDLSVADQAAPDLAAFSCAANAFLSCGANNLASYCNAAGDGTTTIDCGGAGCHGPSSCGQCTVSSCGGSTLSACDTFGRATSKTCSLGCLGVAGDADAGVPPSAHCQTIAPTNGWTLDCVNPSATDVRHLQANTTFDTEAGLIGGVAPPTGVFDATNHTFHFKSLTLDSARRLTGAAGPGNFPLVILVDGDITINGTLDVAGHLASNGLSATGGPGATMSMGDGNSGKAVGAALAAYSGGGGGGYGTNGSSAGNASPGVPFSGKFGSAYPNSADPTIISPLFGGAQGGASPAGAMRAQGGGAVQLVACGAISVASGALVNAGGSGAPSTSVAGGQGGGAGGAILLEASAVTLGGVLAANGGTGGGGGVGGRQSAPGTAGADAATDGLCTVTGGLGAVSISSGGNGGLGTCGTTLATTGGNATITTVPAGGGGGGGGGGRIRINTITPFVIGMSGTVTPSLASDYATGPLGLQ